MYLPGTNLLASQTTQDKYDVDTTYISSPPNIIRQH